MTARFLVGDVHDRLTEIADASVDLVLTSPPFLALRSYLPDGHPDKVKEIGSEATPAAYIDVLLELTAEWGRVLAPHGSVAVELGDTYAGSGGAGGDYGEDGLRDGQPAFGGSGRLASYDDQRGNPDGMRDTTFSGANTRNGGGTGWPLPKSLACIPQLYQVALAYGINPLTGTASPAGRWRVRTLKPWIRSNPPVGALGDKERPATSYVVVACRATDRWFDLDAVRSNGSTNPTPRAGKKEIANPDRGTCNEGTGDNPAGAPPRDWWHHVDAVLDAELAARAGKYNGGEVRTVGPSSASKGISGGDSGNPDKLRDNGARSIGAQGVHLRRALERAGIFTTQEALDVSPKGYSGAHYAVWPPELGRLFIDEMCPRRVCTTCGQPSRRLGQHAFGRQPELAAHIKERREALGIKSAEVNGWFGYKEIAKNWERIDQFGAAVPSAKDWPLLKERLGLSDDFDDFVLSRDRSLVEYEHDGKTLAPGERRGDYGRGGHAEMPGQAKAKRRVMADWSDCGHNTWRPGHILDPFAGSGTTLAVATGMARTATGIDIDERNAYLALERVGMFLDIDHPTREATA